jgi:outer membrane lipoprotein LolB
MSDSKFLARALSVLALVLALSACAVREQRPSGAWLEEREQLFAGTPVWSVNGRVALSDGQRGGSLAFDWVADGQEHDVRLRTVTGGRQWRLRFSPDSAFLEGSDVGQIRGPEPDALVEHAVGWPIPVRDLAYWIRGLVPTESHPEIRYAADGTLTEARSEPWLIQFERFELVDAVLMPSRLQAQSASYRVRLVLRNWNLTAHEPANSL